MAITPLMPVYPRCDVRPVRGEGVYLYGEKGEKYLDFASGIAVNLLGHGHPHLTKAIQEQAATLMHVSNLYGSPQGEKFAQRLVDLTFADTVFFTNSGAEAVECAIKTARRYHHAKGNPHKNTLITFSNAFHGRTMATISATDQDKLRDGFAPLLPGFTVVQFDDLDAATAAIDANTAGFLVEPIQGEGGIRPASQAFMQRAARFAAMSTTSCWSSTKSSAAWRAPARFTPMSIMASRPTSWLRQGHRRRLPARRLPRHRAAPLRAWPSAPTARPMAATRSRWPRGRRCSTSSPMTNSSAMCGRWASACAPRSSR